MESNKEKDVSIKYLLTAIYVPIYVYFTFVNCYRHARLMETQFHSPSLIQCNLPLITGRTKEIVKKCSAHIHLNKK